MPGLPEPGGAPTRLVLPPEPPAWATRSVAEDGAITHELVSSVHPLVRRWTAAGWEGRPTDISMSCTDHLVDDGWVRSSPTLQVEGGSYPAEDAEELVRALSAMLSTISEVDHSS
jgi:hypothetical protein